MGEEEEKKKRNEGKREMGELRKIEGKRGIGEGRGRKEGYR